VKDLPSLFVKTACQFRNGLVVHAIANGKIDATFVDGLFGVLLRVHGGSNNLDAFFSQAIGSREGRQLLLAIGSPVTPVEEYDPPITCQVVRKTQGPTADFVDLE
jgi:hypothetical protein